MLVVVKGGVHRVHGHKGGEFLQLDFVLHVVQGHPRSQGACLFLFGHYTKSLPALFRQVHARRDKAADDHVLLEAGKVVDGAGDSSLSKYARGLLERGRRKEALRAQRCPGNAEKHGRGPGGARRPPPVRGGSPRQR